MSQDLFSQFDDEVLTQGIPDIAGLRYYPGLLSEEEQAEILRQIDSLPWQSDLKRRVQHYGYKYDYKARSINHSMRVGQLPNFARQIGQRLLDLSLISEMPDQMIANEYRPGQGITAHVDCEPCFKDTIVTVSLGSVYTMDFICLETQEVQSVRLELGSALIIRGDARYKWMHRIRSRMNDDGIPRGRRVSLTFRNVILES
jgi:alkylated DNA repair dioxygenase AlkB